MNSASTSPSARTVLGVPSIPPAFASEATTRIRDRIGRIHRRMAPPPVQILEAALSLLEHRVLVALCDAGVPEALSSKMSTKELAAKIDVDHDKLDRLTRFAAARGWLRLDRKGRLHPNATTEFLKSDHPGGWRSWVDFAGGAEVTNAVQALSCKGTKDPFATENGEPFFEWMASHPDRWSVFDSAMAAGARMHGLMLDAAIDWNGANRICDVGGGTGELARVLLDRHSDWEAAVLDLPAVVDRVVEHPRLTAIPGDAFQEIPSGFDAYLLVNVLHDWDDESCIRLLANTAGAAPTGAQVIVVDSTRQNTPRDDLSLRADILMAALTPGGRERSADMFWDLGGRAGLEVAGTTRLASGDSAFRFRVR